LDYIVQSQHNQKCPLISKDKSFLKGGQFAPAWTDHFDRQKVVNLLRRRLDILSGVSRNGFSKNENQDFYILGEGRTRFWKKKEQK